MCALYFRVFRFCQYIHSICYFFVCDFCCLKSFFFDKSVKFYKKVKAKAYSSP
jgi:hypothetical protein